MVRALDTNILVRVFAQDDPEQLAITASLLAKPFLILPTVLIELIWVLSSSYQMDRVRISAQLQALLGMPTAHIASSEAVTWALERYRSGGDFADMLHFALAAEMEATSFATFDKRIKDKQVAGLPTVLERLA